MKRRTTVTLLVLLVLLLNTSSTSLAAPKESVQLQGPELIYVNAVSIAGPWEAEIPWAFSMFKRFGWGTEVKVKATGQQWVHISVPNTYFLNNAFYSVSSVEFCAKSSNPGGTTGSKPIRVDVWSYDTRISTQNISWGNNTNIQCFGPTYNPALLYRDITISVLLKFGNVNHKITLYRAEVVTKANY